MAEPTKEMIREFVRESNAIEDIHVGAGDPLWDDHMAAARKVAYEALPDVYARDPRLIHRVLMDSEEHKFPGEYRQVRVAVGGEEKMRPVSVRPAMAALLSRCPSERSDNEIWTLHYEFERIHPFVGGNGRTGRLWMNALRQIAGLDWSIVRASERHAYYDRIRAYERSLKSPAAVAPQQGGTGDV